MGGGPTALSVPERGALTAGRGERVACRKYRSELSSGLTYRASSPPSPSGRHGSATWYYPSLANFPRGKEVPFGS